MVLGIFINQAFYTDGEKISTDLSFIRFIESFSNSFSDIKIFAPSKRVNNQEGHGLYECKKSISLCKLPYFDNVKELAQKAYDIIPKTISVLKKELPDCDIMWIVGPHPLGLIAEYYAKKNKVMSFLHIRSNILNDIKTRYNNSIIGKAYAGYMHFSNKFLSKRITTLTVGSELYNLYKKDAKNLSWISPSLISKRDIEVTKSNRIQKISTHTRYVKLLFVGRIEPEKGLQYMFRALKNLNKDSIIKYELVVVGCAQRGSEEKEAKIKNTSAEMGLAKYISWKGYVTYGEELKAIYRNSDIFIVPSLAEGIPKVIYEAMAFGLPIISTKVGGIPDIIEHGQNGLIIRTKSYKDISNAVKQIVNDPVLRMNLITEGLKDAEKYTIESSRERILDLFLD